jgi:hypothetical protein
LDGSSGCGVRESQAVIRSLVEGERGGGGREDGPRGIGTGHDRLGSIVRRRSRLVLSSNPRQYSVRRGRETAKGLTVMASPTDVPYPRNDISTLSLFPFPASSSSVFRRMRNSRKQCPRPTSKIHQPLGEGTVPRGSRSVGSQESLSRPFCQLLVSLSPSVVRTGDVIRGLPPKE